MNMSQWRGRAQGNIFLQEAKERMNCNVQWNFGYCLMILQVKGILEYRTIKLNPNRKSCVFCLFFFMQNLLESESTLLFNWKLNMMWLGCTQTCLHMCVCRLGVLMERKQFGSACDRSRISTLLNMSRMTADLISRRQDLICVMISLRTTCDHTNWLLSLSLSPPSSLCSLTVYHESTDRINKRKTSDCASKLTV